jgi:tetratricopeptide (TPR) repeat protein
MALSFSPQEIERIESADNEIRQLISSKNYREAFEIYFQILAGNDGGKHIISDMCDYERALKIVPLFFDDANPANTNSQLTAADNNFLLCEWGMAAHITGNLDFAQLCFSYSTILCNDYGLMLHLSVTLQNLGLISISRGLLPKAKDNLQDSLHLLSHQQQPRDYITYTTVNSTSALAYTAYLLGYTIKAEELFANAKQEHGSDFGSFNGLFESEFVWARYGKERALEHVKAVLDHCITNNRERDMHMTYATLGLLLLPAEVTLAQEHWHKVNAWALLTQDMECRLRSLMLKSEIEFCLGNYDTAIKQAVIGSELAEEKGFGIHAVVFLLQLCKLNLKISSIEVAEEYASKAIERASADDCCNNWAIANGNYLLAKAAHNPQLKTKALQVAHDFMEKIHHPQLDEVRELLLNG